MGKDSALYWLMIVRMNGIVSDDGKYQAGMPTEIKEMTAEL